MLQVQKIWPTENANRNVRTISGRKLQKLSNILEEKNVLRFNRPRNLVNASKKQHELLLRLIYAGIPVNQYFKKNISLRLPQISPH